MLELLLERSLIVLVVEDKPRPGHKVKSLPGNLGPLNTGRFLRLERVLGGRHIELVVQMIGTGRAAVRRLNDLCLQVILAAAVGVSVHHIHLDTVLGAWLHRNTHTNVLCDGEGSVSVLGDEKFLATGRNLPAGSGSNSRHLVDTATKWGSRNSSNLLGLEEVLVGNIIERVTLEPIRIRAVPPAKADTVCQWGGVGEEGLSVVHVVGLTAGGQVGGTHLRVGSEGSAVQTARGAAHDGLHVTIPKVGHERAIGECTVLCVRLQSFVVWPRDARVCCVILRDKVLKGLRVLLGERDVGFMELASAVHEGLVELILVAFCDRGKVTVFVDTCVCVREREAERGRERDHG